MTCVAECGGRELKINVKGRRDTLLDALEILRSVLPPNFIPEKHLEMLPGAAKAWRLYSKKNLKKAI
jgi:hypothetical protein